MQVSPGSNMSSADDIINRLSHQFSDWGKLKLKSSDPELFQKKQKMSLRQSLKSLDPESYGLKRISENFQSLQQINEAKQKIKERQEQDNAVKCIYLLDEV